MKITVKLFATLRKGRFKISECDYPDGTTVGQIIDHLGIPREELELGIIFINGKHAEFHTVLKHEDILAVFPPVAGG